MPTAWTPVFVLPNVELIDPIETDFAAIVPATDSRIVSLCRKHSSFRSFLNRFSDNFGAKFKPTVFLLHKEAPASFHDVHALASFRDSIAIPVICYNRSLELKHPQGHRLLFGDAFAIYPWMLDKHYEHMIGNTPAILGLHDVEKFKGQSSPSLFRKTIDTRFLDEPLLSALFARWHSRWQTDGPKWEDVALFRSLNMAYHASLLPAGTETTFYDIGRLISLWVSAFEILVHPGGNERANCDKVFRLINSTSWELRASADLSYDLSP